MHVITSEPDCRIKWDGEGVVYFLTHLILQNVYLEAVIGLWPETVLGQCLSNADLEAVIGLWPETVLRQSVNNAHLNLACLPTTSRFYALGRCGLPVI